MNEFLYYNSYMQKKLKILFITLSVVFLVLVLGLISLKHFITYAFISAQFNNITGLKVEFIKPKTTFDFKFNINNQRTESIGK